MDHLDEVDRSIAYHWDKTKKKKRHNKMVNRFEPIDSTDIEEIDYQINKRKKIIQEGTAFYQAIDGFGDAGRDVGICSKRPIDTDRLLKQLSYNKNPVVQKILDEAASRRYEQREEEMAPEPVRAAPPRPQAKELQSPNISDTRDQSDQPTVTEVTPQKVDQSLKDHALLEKELILGRNLLSKALANVTETTLNTIANQNSLDSHHLHSLNCFFRLLHYTSGEAIPEDRSFEELQKVIGDNLSQIMSQLGSFFDRFNALDHNDESVEGIKRDFIQNQSPSGENESQEISHIKELLCEAFCLIDIKSDLANQTEGSFDLNS